MILGYSDIWDQCNCGPACIFEQQGHFYQKADNLASDQAMHYTHADLKLYSPQISEDAKSHDVTHITIIVD